MTAPHAEHGAPTVPTVRTADDLPIPARAAGVDLVGEMRGTGYRRPPRLVRRGDGQSLHLTPLLYEVLSAIDGVRGYHEVAAEVSERTGRTLSPGDAAFLIETKLRPLGVLRGLDGRDPENAPKANPLLALRLKVVVSDPERTNRITAPFAALFRPTVVIAVLAVFLASVWWIMFDKGLGSATHQALHDPRLLLLVVGLTVLSAGFHEFGHAAACRYGGATPGVMGAGLYLVWPAFYTDVTDSYRLGRWGRLRVDVGGLYFNAVFAVGIVGAWALTRWDALLLVVATQVLQMARQLIPLVRFDGYHILADLTGVPDLFLHLKPTLAALWPGNWGRPQNKVLKPWARAVVVTWVLVVVPVLAALLVALVFVFPRLVATAWSGFGVQLEVLAENWAAGELAEVGVRVLAMLSLAIPALSVAYLLARIARRTARKVWALAGANAGRRLAVLLAGLWAVSAVAWAWWPGERYTPVEPADRGVVQDLFPAVLLPPSSAQPSEPATVAPQSRAEAAPAPAPTAAETLPSPSPSSPPVPATEPAQIATASAPEPAASASTPTATAPPVDRGPWPFPWPRPDTAEAEDNLALSAATRDRRAEYDVALSEVWVHDGAPVHHVNAAHAYTACVDCSAVAAAYQVVFIVGTDNTEAIPQNHAVAATYECERCVAHAAAVQTVATLTAMPDRRTRAELTRILRSLEGLRGNIRQMDILAVHARMEAVEAQVLGLLDERGYLAVSQVDDETGTDGVASAEDQDREVEGEGEQVTSPDDDQPTAGDQEETSEGAQADGPPDASNGDDRNGASGEQNTSTTTSATKESDESEGQPPSDGRAAGDDPDGATAPSRGEGDEDVATDPEESSEDAPDGGPAPGAA